MDCREIDTHFISNLPFLDNFKNSGTTREASSGKLQDMAPHRCDLHGH